MSNEEILNKLRDTSGDDNAKAVKELLPQWNKEEPFPVVDALAYIRMQEWTYDTFGYAMEKVITNNLPEWFLRVFFDMKEFRSNKRNELASTCVLVSKMKGYPMKTQDDKAFCLYNYALQKYYKEA